MTPTEWGIVIAAIAAVPRGVAALENVAKSWLSARKSDRPPASSSSSGDKMRAVAVELQSAETIDKVNELHEALAQKHPLTKAYLIPEHVSKQTELLTVIKDESVKQTEVMRRIANQSSPNVPRPDGTYRRGGE